MPERSFAALAIDAGKPHFLGFSPEYAHILKD
jgi:hypothetical protein